MIIDREPFGRFWNHDVTRYTLSGEEGARVEVLDYGAIIQTLSVPGRRGPADVVLGFDTLYEYLRGHPFFGAVAGRVANRIPDGRFELDGVEFELSVNAPFHNHLHGGVRGFDKYVWESDAYRDGDSACVRLHRISHDGEEGYPGNLDVTIVYSLAPGNTLTFNVEATTDAPTIVNVAQHSYFNLSGHDQGDIKSHELEIAADAVTPTDDRLIPTGEIRPVDGTPYDLRESKRLEEVFSLLDGSVDINYALHPEEDGVAARLRDPMSGRMMEMSTNMPGLQLYNGHKLAEQGTVGKGGHPYPAWAGLCLETQHFPNAINRPHFPSMVLRPGEEYRHETSYTFTVD